MNSYFPPEWQDDERRRVLMGPMPSARDSVALNSRITFWTAALHSWSRTKEGLTFTLNDAQMAFRRGTQVPACLPQIFEHLVKQGDFITYEDLIKPINDTESWVNWSKRILIATPSKWAWNALQDTVGGKSLENKMFINWKVLQEKSDKLLCFYWGTPLKNLPFNPEDVITVEDLFRCVNASLALTFEDLNIILHYLVKKRKIAIMEHHGKSLVKLVKPGQTEPLLITEMEVAEHQLRVTGEKLEERLKCSQNEEAQLRKEIKDFIRLGHKNKALLLLRRKKRCEKSMEATLLALENLSTCLHQLQESKLNVDVLNAFQLGANALKSSFTNTGSVDEVSNAMDNLQDVLDECRDITDTLSFGIQSPENQDETELEIELTNLMLEETYATNRTVTEGPRLPDVPQSNPLEMLNRSREQKSESGLHY